MLDDDDHFALRDGFLNQIPAYFQELPSFADAALTVATNFTLKSHFTSWLDMTSEFNRVYQDIMRYSQF